LQANSLGIGTFLYTLSDMQNVISRKISHKVKHQLESVGWKDTNVERTGRVTRRAMRLAIWDVQNKFYKQLDETTKKRGLMISEKKGAEDKVGYWKDVAEKTKVMDASVQSIEFPDAKK